MNTSNLRQAFGRRPKRFVALSALLLLTMSLAIPLVPRSTSAQVPDLVLTNALRDTIIQRKADGGFIARPLFNRELYPEIDGISYRILSAKTGDPVHMSAYTAPQPRGNMEDWATPIEMEEGKQEWEHMFDFPPKPKPAFYRALDPEEYYLLEMTVVTVENQNIVSTFGTIIPVYQESGILHRILQKLDPDHWGRAISTWVVGASQSVLCAVVNTMANGTVENCVGTF